MKKLVMSGDNKELFEIEEKSLSEKDLKKFISIVNDYINKSKEQEGVQNHQNEDYVYIIFCQSSTIKEQIESEIQKLNLPYSFEYFVNYYIDSDKIYLMKNPENKPIKIVYEGEF